MANYNVLIEQDEDGCFVSEVVELPGCHTQAKNLDELMKRTKEAIALYVKCRQPAPNTERFVGLQLLEV
ncbi:type II toxin-antitoxin system HicB family antitoxin [Candidatus Micrarchaeota archaeon]|nr:type II toxin-antitoxin system HicB family antitoxin [Candidatus Micrarchaeota archaeon]